MLATAAAIAIPLEDFADEVLRAYAPRVARSSFRKRCDALAVLRRLIPGARTTADLTPATMGALEAAMSAAGLAPMTIWTHLSHLRAACGFAVDRGYLESNPIPTRPGGRRNVLEGQAAGPSAVGPAGGRAADDVTRLLVHLADHSASWEGHRLFVLAATVVYVGLRKNEALRLEWSRYDPGSRRLDLPSESPPVRRAVHPFLADALDQWRPRCMAQWIFPGVRLGGRWNDGPTGKKPIDQLKQAARDAGIGAMTFERLRDFWEAHPGGISLPDVEGHTPPTGRSGGPTVPRPGPPRVALDLSRGRRRARVRGVPLDSPLTPREFAILRALADAARRGGRLSARELEAKSGGHSEPDRTLRALRERPQLADVILFPGGNGRGGYGLAIL